MKLYFTPGACSLAPHIVLREGGFKFELEQVDLDTKKTAGGADFLEINPKGYVPALQLDEGTVLTEVPVVLQYLADLRAESGLAPAAGSLQRYRLQEWLNFITSELHKGLSPLFNPELPEAAQQIVRDTAAKKFSYVDRHLDGRRYLLDGQFTVADSYAFAIINWKNFFNIDLAPWPNVAAYYDRIAERPSVYEALQAEGLVDK